ncbi:Putative endolytic murein transglycosylase, MltG-like [Desulfonema magnum]|uniref:Endolytic murein transglycosylase n=1 Tax=Desulfonema magnum TaxID=45655 RepID=A0A975BX78_9BACT|nr:Putative endolytic murein transglycosylase, MltG-like [Desulfonema magnum]
MKKLLVIILFSFIGVFSYFFLDILRYADISANTDQEIFVVVPPGQRFSLTSEQLHQAGIIKNPYKFRLLARIKGHDKKIKAGEYRLSSAMSPNEILDIMAKGKVFLCKLTLPEGYDLHQIASTVAKLGLGSEKEFLAAATDTDFIHEKGINAWTFEGYLFPDTYYFPKGVTAKKMISTLVSRFWSVFTPEWKEQAEKLKLSVHQVVTLASIIEKETGVAAERPVISSVFHNRLKKRMRLQSDPTVIYGIKDFNGNITRKHLKTLTPYNTYKIKGLPPGPIANPGAESIKSALWPADTSYLYFVSKKDSTHKFSKTLKDHNRAVRKYQLSK